VWKFCKTTGYQVRSLSHSYADGCLNASLLKLLHVRTGSVKAIYEHNPSHVARGIFKGQFKTYLRIHPSCTLDPDILILTFIVMEKKRRDGLGDHVNVAAAKEENVVEANVLEGGGGGLM
jgi:hypothetical protein